MQIYTLNIKGQKDLYYFVEQHIKKVRLYQNTALGVI